MRIHAMTMVKDEADIVAECLEAATDWADHVYVFDNGSTDGSWDIVQGLAAEHPAIVPWKSDDVTFHDGLRAQIFEAFRARSEPGDWWCRLDTDEFYVDDPRVFLRKVPERYRVVWMASFSYYFTDKDAERYEQDPELYADDVPIEEKIRYYVNHWSEPRFFRYREDIRWASGGFPAFVESSAAYPVRIWQKHFAYRSPQQIGKRLAARHPDKTGAVFEHETIADWGTAVGAVRSTRDLMERSGAEFATLRWEDRVVPAASLDYDEHDRRLAVNESLMPPLPTDPTLAQRLRRLRHRGVDALRALRRRLPGS
jgi:hypothetical protein